MRFSDLNPLTEIQNLRHYGKDEPEIAHKIQTDFLRRGRFCPKIFSVNGVDILSSVGVTIPGVYPQDQYFFVLNGDAVGVATLATTSVYQSNTSTKPQFIRYFRFISLHTSLRGKGLARPLYDYVIDTFGVFASDEGLTPSSAAIWRRLCNDPRNVASIVVLDYNDRLGEDVPVEMPLEDFDQEFARAKRFVVRRKN